MRSAAVSVSAVLVAAILVDCVGAMADIDASGPWLVDTCSVEFGCSTGLEQWTQNGTSLSTGFSPDGTIDPMTGQFSEAVFVPLCGMFSTRSGTVAADVLTFAASGITYVGASPTLCFFPISVFYSGTRCGTGTLEPGEACDDGNADNGDGCNSSCQVELCYTCVGEPSVCTPGPDGPCDDANPCTIETCDAQLHCHHDADLRTCRSAEKSVLVLNAPGTDQNKLTWKWLRGEATAEADFAEPRTSASYTFCLFAGTAAVTGATLPPGAAWSGASGQFRYRDPGAAIDGIKKILLRPGAAGAAKILVKAKGAALAATPPPLDLPVTAQLHNSDTDLCWSAAFDAADVSRNEGTQFKARSHSP